MIGFEPDRPTILLRWSTTKQSFEKVDYFLRVLSTDNTSTDKSVWILYHTNNKTGVLTEYYKGHGINEYYKLLDELEITKGLKFENIMFGNPDLPFHNKSPKQK